MKIKYKLLIILLMGLFFYPSIAKAENNVIPVYFFYGESCPHCAELKPELLKLKAKYNIKISFFEVWNNDGNSELLSNIKKELGSNDSLVPYIVIGTDAVTGYNENTINKITRLLDNYTDECDLVGGFLGYNKRCIIDYDTGEAAEVIKLPILGDINPQSVSLPIVALVVGLIDGFNPCAMWVLLFLITMLINMKNKKRMWILGLTFILSSALIYFLIMFSWLTVAVSISKIKYVRYAIALIALIGAIFNIKSFLHNPDNGCDVVNTEKRKKIFSKIKKFTREKSIVLALIGIISLAISVNVVELACSAGLPLLFTQILALNHLATWQSLIYMFMYIVAFMLDDMIVFIIAMMTAEVTGISTKYGRITHLFGAFIMLLIGLLLIFRPDIIMFNF